MKPRLIPFNALPHGRGYYHAGKEEEWMSVAVKDALTLDAQAMRKLDERMETLTRDGVAVNEAPSGELNFSGCARGYCQAWD